jgi:hypothetical protein
MPPTALLSEAVLSAADVTPLLGSMLLPSFSNFIINLRPRQQLFNTHLHGSAFERDFALSTALLYFITGSQLSFQSNFKIHRRTLPRYIAVVTTGIHHWTTTIANDSLFLVYYCSPKDTHLRGSGSLFSSILLSSGGHGWRQ